MKPLDGVDAMVLDMDGVLYRGDEAVPGSAAAVAELRRRGVAVLFCTNNSSRTPAQYVARLAAIGIEASEDEVLTSGVVTASVLSRRGLAGARAIVIGRDGIRQALAGAGIEVCDDPEVDEADLVVVGWDPGFDFQALRRASSAARNGALFVATNSDATFPHEHDLWPGAGSILAAVETAAGRRAEVMGKPHAPMMEEAERRLDGRHRIAMVGDRPETDLAGAVARGWVTVLVLSGVTTEAQGVEPPPDAVADSLADLVAGQGPG